MQALTRFKSSLMIKFSFEMMSSPQTLLEMEKPRNCGAFLLRLAGLQAYLSSAIRASKADFEGRVSDSGSVPSG